MIVFQDEPDPIFLTIVDEALSHVRQVHLLRYRKGYRPTRAVDFQSMGPGLFRNMGPPGAVPSRDEFGWTPAGGAGRRMVVGRDRG